MINLRKVEELAGNLSRLFPQDSEIVREELKNNIHAMVVAALARMELVTREEFDAQTAVLQKTRAKVEALEKVVAGLEAEHKS